MDGLHGHVATFEHILDSFRCLPSGESNPSENDHSISNITKVNLEKLFKFIQQEIIIALEEGDSRFILNVQVLSDNLSLMKVRIKVFHF